MNLITKTMSIPSSIGRQITCKQAPFSCKYLHVTCDYFEQSNSVLNSTCTGQVRFMTMNRRYSHNLDVIIPGTIIILLIITWLKC